jgi:gamma-glutamyltranspeptidase/glutathione hydrolase
MQTKQLLLAALLIVGGPTMFHDEAEAQDRSQARSMVISRYGIVASESPLASQAGASILARGGHAVDAAVAANAVMGLVAPGSNGIGGDLFAIVYEAESGKFYGLNASGWAPAALTIEALKQQGHDDMPSRGPHSVTVPGTVDGWAKLLQRFGRMDFAQVLSPAIRHAEEGFPVTEWVAAGWARGVKLIRRDDNAARTFLIKGRAPAVGEVFRNPDLAWSLRQISREGRDAFYQGKIATRIVETLKRHGSLMAAEDLAEYSSQWADPISTTYRGWTVYEMPPNGQGIAALIMLNLMERFPLAHYSHNSARALHLMIESKKLAYADMVRYVADPEVSLAPVEGMLSKQYADKRARLIDEERAACHVQSGQPPGASDDTIYLSVVDREGNMVSLIQSISSGFGSTIVPDGTGFFLHNRGALFTLAASHPNALAGRKRPLHTIIPAFMEKEETRIAFGIMGGWNQSQAHAQFVSNIVDFGMNIQEALEAARFSKRTFDNCDVRMEARVPTATRAELIAKGHEIELQGDFSPWMGGGQAVMRDLAAGVNYGASDPRKDGLALPEPLPAK